MIILSIGHHPNAKGACDKNGLCEYDIIGEWVPMIQELIDPIYPCKIIETGSLKYKVEQINAEKSCVLAVEFHLNSNVRAKGVEALYHPNSKSGKVLAKKLTDGFSKRKLFLPNRGAKEGYYQMNPDKPVDYFLRKTNPVACIFEPEFISNIKGIIKNKDRACKAIADILLDFVETELGESID